MGRTKVRAALGLLPVLAATAAATAGGPPGERPKGGAGVAATSTAQVVNPVVEGNTRFALDLYARLREGPGNRFFSPYSLSTALAMTYAGARDATAAEMADTLHFTLAPDRLHPAFHALIAHINGEGAPGAGAAGQAATRRFQLLTANALWGQQGEGFLPGFLDLTRANYGAGLREVDFRHHTEEARRAINAWVEQQTADKIKDLVGPSDLTRDTALVLTNAIYFKGDWAHPFEESRTKRDGTFNAPGGRKVTVPMMAQTRAFPYFDGGSFQLLELPYAGDELAMDVLLPRETDGLPALEAQLTPENLAGWLRQASRAQAEVELPRFSLTEEFRLADALRQMGMPAAFDRDRADFSGMNGKRNLAISEVIHKAFVDVNEKGTEAAAATAVTMVRTMAVLPQKTVQFRADHPFVFLIRDRSTGSVLFLGRLVEPKG
jgi:serpin B